MSYKNSIINSFRITFPILGFMIFLLLAIYGNIIFDSKEEVELSLGIIAIKHEISELELRLVFGVMAIFCLFFFFTRNYVSIFPNLLNMHVSFDDHGTEKLLLYLQKDKRFSFDIYNDWKYKKRNFWKEVAQKLENETEENSPTFEDDSMFQAEGHTSFFVEKIAKLSQYYKVIKSNGNIVFHDAKTNSKFETSFSLQDTPYSLIHLSIFDMLIKHSVIINPVISQKYRIVLLEEIFFVNVIACTKIRFLPALTIGQTLYLIKNKKKFFPIGYCKYTY